MDRDVSKPQSSPDDLVGRVRRGIWSHADNDATDAQEALDSLFEQLEAAEKARKNLTHALAFYADFEESGHSDWSVATDTLEALYERVPQPGEAIPDLAVNRWTVSSPAREPDA